MGRRNPHSPLPTPCYQETRMSHENLKRRDFIKGAATAGLSAPLLAGESLAEAPRQNQLPALGQARPVIISSPNGANVPKRGVEPRGISCLDLAMRMLKEGRDTLEAVVAGVNIVEDDPDDNTVGYGGLPNEDGEVELDASVMHGPTRRAGAVASIRSIKNPSRVAKVVMEQSNHVLLVGPGARRFAEAHGFERLNLLTERSRTAWLAWKAATAENWRPGLDSPEWKEKLAV